MENEKKDGIQNIEAVYNLAQETASTVKDLVPIVSKNAVAIAQIGEEIREISKDTRDATVKLASLSEPKGIPGNVIIAITSVMIGFGGLLLSVIMAVGTLAYVPVSSAQSKFDKDINSLESAFVEHIKDGHPERIEQRIESADNRFADFKTQTQKDITRIEDKVELHHSEIMDWILEHTNEHPKGVQ